MKLSKLPPALFLMLFFFFPALSQKSTVLYNGLNLKNWKSIGKSVFSPEKQILNSSGEEGWLFYQAKNVFKNFELTCKVKSSPNASDELLFHVKSGADPKIQGGYAICIKNTYDGPVAGDAIRMTGSISGIRNVYFPFVKDQEWFDLKIEVNDQRIRIFVNEILVNEYTEIPNAWRPAGKEYQKLSSGTIAIHHLKGEIQYQNMQIKEIAPQPVLQDVDDDYDKLVTFLHAENFPLVDFHVHLKGGLTIDEVVANARKLGMNYGVAANCGLKFPVTNNQELNIYLNSIRNAPVFKGMQAEGREWMTLFSPDSAARFDYIFTDAMTWTNTKGMRMRLWIKEETEVGDPQLFMDELVSKIEGILQEPIDIYVNPTYIPDEISAQYDELWTPERMDKVIQGLVNHKVALEINSRYKIPSIEFLKRAKAAGVKFTFGTNNTGRNDLDYQYCFKVLREVGLTPADMWLPRKPENRKIFKYTK